MHISHLLFINPIRKSNAVHIKMFHGQVYLNENNSRMTAALTI